MKIDETVYLKDLQSFAYRHGQFLPNYIHDNLVRCGVCKLKYTLTELKKENLIYKCRFCLGDSNV